jgi:hypothetical protein
VRRRKTSLLGLTVVASIAVLVAALAVLDGDSKPSHERSPAPVTAAGLNARFDYLAHRHSSRCGTPPSYVRGLSDSARLQGACCFPMNRAAYRSQVSDLRLRAPSEAPSDPYDVSAALAKRLLAYERTIALTPTEQPIYRRAMSMTSEHGPCCCPCWRWHAFAGLSKELIARRRWTAPRLARLISLLDGCGGAADHPGKKPHGMPS